MFSALRNLAPISNLKMDIKSDDTVGSGEEAYLSDDFDEIDEIQNTLLPRVMDLMSKMNDNNDQDVDDHCLRLLHNFQATETKFIQNQVSFLSIVLKNYLRL